MIKYNSFCFGIWYRGSGVCFSFLQPRYRGPALEGDSWIAGPLITPTQTRRVVSDKQAEAWDRRAMELEGALKEREIREIVSIEVEGNAG